MDDSEAFHTQDSFSKNLLDMEAGLLGLWRVSRKHWATAAGWADTWGRTGRRARGGQTPLLQQLA